jgi:hypothetical protein
VITTVADWRGQSGPEDQSIFAVAPDRFGLSQEPVQMRLIRRFAGQIAAAAGCLLVFGLFLPPAVGNTIDVALNVSYMNDTDPMSGGTWSLVAKSGPTTAGINSLNLRLTNVDGITLVAPIGVVNGDDPAGFDLGGVTEFDDHTNVLIAQRPLPSGTSEQTLFYGVGTLTDGAPDYPGKPMGSMSIGPTFTTLTNVQNVPWAMTPVMPGIFDVPGWETAATFLTGTFTEGVTPGFYTEENSTGSAFSAVGSASVPGPLLFVIPLTSTIVRTNFVATGGDADYNNDGFVNAADYTVWRNSVGTAILDADGSGPGGVPDGVIDRFDYDFWKVHYGETVPGAGSGAVGGNLDIPEPASGLLFLVGVSFLAGRVRFGGRETEQKNESWGLTGR